MRVRAMRCAVVLTLVAVVAATGAAGAWADDAIRESGEMPVCPAGDEAKLTARAVAPSSGCQSGPTDPEELEVFLDEFLRDRMETLDVPGLAFALVKDGELFFSKGYGYGDLEKEVAVDPGGTVFRIGSVAKLFTATAAMQLVEDGRIDLHADVNQYLRGFQIPDTYPKPVTMAHLLTHTGGFDEKLLGTFAASPEDLRPLAPYLADEMPRRVMGPGEVTSYSNHGMALAGYIVEAVCGKPFEAYVADEIFGPLGMARSSFAQPLPPSLQADMAQPYPRGLQRGEVMYTPIAPAGMLSTTAHDMARFLIAHLEHGGQGDARILEEETVGLMHARQFSNHPNIPGWAYGFTERTENGVRVLDHGGADPSGYGSIAVLLPEEDLGFFAVANTVFRDELLLELPSAFLDHYYPTEPVPDLKGQVLQGSAARANHVSGTYLTNRHARHTIAKLALLSQPPVQVRAAARESGLLEITGLGYGEPGSVSRWVEIEPLVFQRQGSEERIAFGEDERGRITHLFSRGHTPGAYDRAAWYQSPTFHQLLVAGCLLVFLSVVVGSPLAALVRRLIGRSRELDRPVRQARRLATAVSVLNAVFLVVALLLISTRPLQYGVPLGVKAIFVLPLITTGMTAAMPVLLARAWRAEWSLLGRAHYGAVTAAAAAFVWFLAHWNLLGFRV